MGADYASDCIAKGGKLRIVEHEKFEGTKILTLENLLKGIAMAVEAGQFDLENYDACGADCVIQNALFGEIVYG
jgi:hypothetical protein